MAPCVAPSPLPLKTPETEVAKGGQAIGGGPGNLRGSISLPLLGAHASDARKNISYGRQKSEKPTVVGISTGFLTFLTLLTPSGRPEGVRQLDSGRTHRSMEHSPGLADPDLRAAQPDRRRVEAEVGQGRASTLDGRSV